MHTAEIWLPFILSLPIIVVGGITLIRLLKSQHVNLLRIYVLCFVLHFVLMPLYGFLAEWISTSQWPYLADEIFSAYLVLYVFLGAILVVLFVFNTLPQRFRRGWSIPRLLEKQYTDQSLSKIIQLFTLIMSFLIAYNLYFGFTSYASGTLERILSVPYPLVVLKSLTTIFIFGLVGYGALHLVRGKRYLLAGVVLLSSNIIGNIYSRRGYLLVIILLILFKYLLDRGRMPVRQVLVVSFIGIFVLKVFFPFLFVFRQLTMEEPPGGKKATNISQTYELTLSTKGEQLGRGRDANEAYRANQVARNIEFMRLPMVEQRYMHGILFGAQLAAVIPRAINPLKLEGGKALAPETIILLFYGRKGFDLADNLPLYGFLEFGYWGVFIVGLFQALYLILLERLVFSFQKIHPFLGLSVLTCAIYNHINLEYPYQQELALFRDLIILYCIAWPLAFLFRLLARHPLQAPQPSNT
ncbi:MAG: hypothetical protein IPK76_25835 [Lewinellaceae bacterium]|nr:hypothetical protein [Lewinellaceae bacterium]